VTQSCLVAAFYQSEVFDCKKAIRLIGPVQCLAINQFVESACLYRMKILIELCRLKGDSGVLKTV
jgi:hypothetical protein